MFKELKARWKQGYRTVAFPEEAPKLPDLYRGLPVVNPSACRAGCRLCEEKCPNGAIGVSKEGLRLDLGLCIFCGECEASCTQGVIHFSKEYRMATSLRVNLVLEGKGKGISLAEPLEGNKRRIFKRSLRLRQVSAGGCNACEADTNVLTTLAFDCGRFGIQFVASPRHADGILVTGPVTENMRTALLKTYEAVPTPKIVIAAGACAISGGPYTGHCEVHNGIEGLLPVDLYIPGCPPHPFTILDGLLRILGWIE